MPSKISKPEDLAKYVFKKLVGVKSLMTNPPIDVLINLFEILFYTSMKTEESNLLRVTVTLIDPKNPDPSPPRRIVAHRWKYIKFDEPIPCTIDSLVKLSKAADPWSSSLAIYYDDKKNLFIWGLIDQSVHYQTFLNYESNSGPEQPGLFQVSIIDIGSIVVLFDYELLATLKQNTLITNYPDVLRLGPISNIFQSYFEPYELEIQQYIKDDFEDEEPEEWDSIVYNEFRRTLSRLLLKIQNYGHGGAILFTKNIVDDVDIKYKAEYNRIPKSIVNIARFTISNYNSTSRIFSLSDQKKLNMPLSLYFENSVSDTEINNTRNELKGAIRFIASQTCVDGLVLFNDKFVAKGFGVILKTKNLPSEIYISSTAIASAKSLSALNPNHFGTRHRSIFSYCWKYKGSVGFVVSQDGDIRAVTRIDDKLIIWNNIRAQQFIKSSKIKRLPPPIINK